MARAKSSPMHPPSHTRGPSFPQPPQRVPSQPEDMADYDDLGFADKVTWGMFWKREVILIGKVEILGNTL